MTINQIAFQYIHAFAGRNPFLDAIAVFCANDIIYFLTAGFIVYALSMDGIRRKIYWLAEGALAVLLSRGLVTETIRFFYYHPRPFDFYGFPSLVPESGASFPSGHMTFLFALAMVMFYANRKWGIVYFLLSLVVGVARIYAGVHWPFDILGGIAVGIVCAMIVHALLTTSKQLIDASKNA